MLHFPAFPLKRNWQIFISLIFSVLWIVAIHFFLGIYFETNDDRYMLEILSGALTGTGNPHIVFINYLISIPLFLLYKITTAIPWYGITLILLHVLSYGIIIYSIMKLCSTWLSLLFRMILLFCILGSSVYITGLLQFTSTAALIAIAGYIYLLCTYCKNNICNKRNYGLFFLMELSAFLIRENAMMMITALGLGTLLGLFLYKYLTEPRSLHENSIFKLIPYIFVKLLPIISGLLLIIAIGKLGNFIGYYDSDWESYQRFNVARANMFDYQGAPSYQDVKHILDKYDVSEKEYNAFCHYTILTDHISADCIEELERYSNTDNASSASSVSQTITSAVINSLQMYRSTDLWSIGKILIYFHLLCVICVFVCKNYFLLFPIAGLFLSRTIVWSFLLYKGRIVNRVSFPLLLCEMLILLILLLVCINKRHNLFDCQNSKPLMICYSGLVIIISLVLFKSFIHTSLQEIRYVKEQNSIQKIYMEGLVELQEYVDSRPSQTFLIEANSLSYYRGNAFDTRVYKPRNALVTGCWYSQSPPMKRRIDSYLNTFDTPIYFIIAEGSEPRFVAILDYLEELFDSTPIVNETFTASHGGTHLVYYFE